MSRSEITVDPHVAATLALQRILIAKGICTMAEIEAAQEAAERVVDHVAQGYGRSKADGDARKAQAKVFLLTGQEP